MVNPGTAIGAEPASAPALAAPSAFDDETIRASRATGNRVERIRRRDSLFRRSLGVADMWSVGFSLLLSTAAFGNKLAAAALAMPPLFVLLAKALGLYDRDEHLLQRSTLEEVPSLFAIATLTTLLVWLCSGFLVSGSFSKGQIVVFWPLLFASLVCLRSLARLIAGRVAAPERCLLLGDAKVAGKLREKLGLCAVRAELVGVVPTEVKPPGAGDGTASPSAAGPALGEARTAISPDIGPILEQQSIDRVIITSGPEVGRDDLIYIIRELKTHGVKVSVLPEASRVAGSSVELDHLHGLTLLGVKGFELSRSSRLVKRCFDLVASSILLILLSPLLIAVAVAVKLGSPGPVLFRDSRIGRHGREFKMVKFRSMIDGADRMKDALRHRVDGAEGFFKISDDPRVTAVGRVIRRLHVDELPQLLNVLRGEMSLVGPRPLPPDEDQKIHGWYRRRLDVPPGITGHWQVLGSATRIPMEEMVKLDYLYVANWSIWGDVKLLLRTLPSVFGRRGV